MKITQQLRIHGKVQGVFFRESMRAQGAVLHVTGWVRNRRDGTVEAMVQGAPEAVAMIVAWARRGPQAARVDHVDVRAGEGDYTTFDRLPTH